jgi:hypothetical protein
MMNLFRWDEFPVSFALLTQRMGFNVTVTDSLPSSAVSSSRIRIPLILFVSPVFLLLMFLTKSSIDKLRTSRIRAGAFRFPWHKTPPAIKKPAATPQVSIFFPSLIVSGSFVTFQFQIVSTRLKHSHLEKDLHKPGPVLPFAQDSQSPFALNDRG